LLIFPPDGCCSWGFWTSMSTDCSKQSSPL